MGDDHARRGRRRFRFVLLHARSRPDPVCASASLSSRRPLKEAWRNSPCAAADGRLRRPAASSNSAQQRDRCEPEPVDVRGRLVTLQGGENDDAGDEAGVIEPLPTRRCRQGARQRQARPAAGAETRTTAFRIGIADDDELVARAMLELEPVATARAAVAAVDTLADYAFEAGAAGPSQHRCSVADVVLRPAQTGMRMPFSCARRCCLRSINGTSRATVTIRMDEVEQHVGQRLFTCRRGDPAGWRSCRDRRPARSVRRRCVRCGSQCLDGRGDLREARRSVESVARPQAGLAAHDRGEQAIAVPFDLMQPVVAGRRARASQHSSGAKASARIDSRFPWPGGLCRRLLRRPAERRGFRHTCRRSRNGSRRCVFASMKSSASRGPAKASSCLISSQAGLRPGRRCARAATSRAGCRHAG